MAIFGQILAVFTLAQHFLAHTLFPESVSKKTTV